MELHWVHPEEFEEREREETERRIRELAGDHTDLIDVRITARASGHHRHGDREVRIVCNARGKELVATRSRPDAGLALHDALAAFEREVWRMRHRRTQRRNERPASAPEHGVIDEVFPEEGYGFILTDSGERVYFHRNAVSSGLSFERLGEGDRVGLNIEGGLKGPQATVVLAPSIDASAP